MNKRLVIPFLSFALTAAAQIGPPFNPPLWSVSVKATATGVVSSTTLATCPANASKFCLYTFYRSMQCTLGATQTGTGVVVMTMTWADGFGTAGSTALAGFNVATCPVSGGSPSMVLVGPGQTLSYSVSAGTGTYSVDYGITVARLQ